jgi:hypothetical protein
MHMRITSFVVTLALFSACSPEHKVDKGRTVSGETPRTDDASNAPRILPEVNNASSEPQVIIAQDSPKTPDAPAPEPVPEMEPDDADANSKTAMEPVPIGGAYLTCRYQNGQTQGSESYRMDCEVAPVKEVGVPIVSAAFFKVDAQGNRSPLPLLSQDLLNLKWTVQESVATMGLGQVLVSLSVPGLLSTTLSTTVNSVFNLVQNSIYWLGGEPNSLNEDEDCVEFVSANGKLSHQSFSGLTSGPLGRMNDIGCTAIHSFLCRNISAGATNPKWTASAASGPFLDGATACGQGYSFGFPLNTAEVREVMTLVDALDIKIWVNMSDRLVEKTFAIKFR